MIYGSKRGVKLLMLLLLLEYIFVLFCSTVLCRPYHETQGFNLLPLWSYEAIAQGKEELIAENLWNITIFVPIGLLIGCSFRSLKWWKVLLIGLSISVVIEVLQFMTTLGFAEIDDVLYNTLGCMVGYGIFLIIRAGCEKISKRMECFL